jgi:hypothetical protein
VSNPRDDFQAPELERLRQELRVTDMMLTMHSILRDRLRRKALLLDLIILAGSAVMCATSFIDRAVLESSTAIGLSVAGVRGITAVSLFVVSLFSLRLDWKERAGRHSKACEALARLKSGIRAWIGRGPLSGGEGTASSREPDYQAVMAQIEPIPESRFVALKAAHKRKVILSRMVDEHPAAPIWFLRVRLFARDTIANLER